VTELGRLLGVVLLVAAAGHAAADEEDPARRALSVQLEQATQPAAEEPAGDASSDPGAPRISLVDAVALALVDNFSLRSQADAVTSARYSEAASRARFHPKFTPSYSTGAGARALTLEASQAVPWTGGSVTAAAAVRQATADDLTSSASDLRLTVSQPLLRGFGETVATFDVRNSERTVESQERSFVVARQRLAIEVAQTFYQVARQRQLLEVAHRSLERSLELKRASEERQSVGLASRLDVLRAELQAEQARDSAVSAEASLQGALEQFRTLLGLSPSARVEPAEQDLPEDAELNLPSMELLLSAAYANRVELAEARDRIEDSRRSLHVARRNLLPQLDVNVAFIQTGFGERFPALNTGLDRRINVFLTTSYPVERAADEAARAQAELDLVQRERTLRQRELDVEAEVRAAVRELERTHKSIQVQRKRVEVADEQHRLATLRYQRGLASNFDVVDAEANLVSARTSLVGLLADFQVERFRLLRTTGELDVEEDFK
jgi:outer membrane protein TolC